MNNVASQANQPNASRQLHWKIFERALLLLVVAEAALGGNGYLVQLDGVRLRVLLFPLCIAWTVLRLTKIEPVRLPTEIVYFCLFFLALTALGAAVGYGQGYSTTAIAAELKPLAYFPMILFFVTSIQTRRDVTLVSATLVACGVVMATLYLLTIAGLRFGFIDESALWELLHTSDEFIFRGFPIVGFLYKGAIFIAVAAIFLIFDPFRITKFLAVVTVIAIAMMLTRGFALALLASILIGFALSREWKRVILFAGLATFLIGTMFLALRSDPSVSQSEATLAIAQFCQRSDATETSDAVEGPGWSLTQNLPIGRLADSDRLADARWIAENTEWSTAAIGHGFGTSIRVPDRPRIELSYLEIFYKQGILGLVIWAALLFYILRLYLKVSSDAHRLGLIFFLVVVFVFTANSVDAILAGSMGMAPIFISAACLLVLAKGRETAAMSVADWYGATVSFALRPLQARDIKLISAASGVALFGFLLVAGLRFFGTQTSSDSVPIPLGDQNPTIADSSEQVPAEPTEIHLPAYDSAKLPRLEPDHALYFCDGHSNNALLAGWWSEPDPEGPWSDGHSAYLGVIVDDKSNLGPPRKAIFHIAAWLVPSKLTTQRVQVWAGNRELGTYRLNSTPADLEIPLAGLGLANGQALILRFYLPDANSPHDVVGSTDLRVVAIRAEALQLVW